MKAIETLRGCWGLVGIADGEAAASRAPLPPRGPLQCIGLREGPLALLAMQRPKENLVGSGPL